MYGTAIGMAIASNSDKQYIDNIGLLQHRGAGNLMTDMCSLTRRVLDILYVHEARSTPLEKEDYKHLKCESTLLAGALGKLFSYLPPVPPVFCIFCPYVGDTLLFENGYFDASFTLGISYIWIFTRFHLFSHIFVHFHHNYSLLG